MRIQSIKIKNFQGLANLAIDVEQPVLFVTGHNGAGKSSLRDAIRIALTGEASRVALKKDYKAMIKEGTKKADITIGTDDGAFSFSLPQAKGVHAESEYVPICVDAVQFCDMKPDERRKILFDLTGCGVSTKRVREMLLAEECDADMIELVLPMLRSGFPAAEKEAKDRASQARGSWKAITGETYGKQKAEDWEPEAVDEPAQDIKQNISELQQKLEQNTKTIHELHQMLGKGKAMAMRLESLKESASKVSRIDIKHQSDKEALEQVNAKVNRLRAADLSQSAMPCPCCNNMIVEKDGQFVEASKLASNITENELGQLPALLDSQAMLERTIRNNERDMDIALNAQKEIDELLKENGGDITENALQGFQSDIGALEQENSELRSSINQYEQQEATYEASLKTADEAAKYHEEVTKWVHIAEQLAPDGIPANILSQAMKPLQTLISNINSLVLNWPAVSINQEMELMADSRLYGLLSESEQWRVQTVITLALAQLSGINLVVLDRIDVLDPGSRIELVEMLLGLTEDNPDLQIIMLGTLANPAKGMPQEVQQVWLEHGEPAYNEEVKAA